VSITVSQLKAAIKQQCFPSGMAENLDLPVVAGGMSASDAIFLEAFAEIAKWVECEKSNNVNVTPFSTTQYKAGMTVIPVVRGVIQRLYTLANCEWSDPVFYNQVEWPGPECMARNRLFPVSNPQPFIGQGVQIADGQTDFIPSSNPQTRWQRARTGVWAIYNGMIYVGPWLQSNESIVNEWRGIKDSWADTDLLNPAQDYRKAVKFYFQYAIERDYGDRQKAIDYKTQFDQALADLMWECREQTKKRHVNQCYNERNRVTAELLDDKVIPTTAAFTTSATTGLIPMTFLFQDQSTGYILTWAWNFGDGTTSTSQNPSHTYTVEGNYTVTLTVTDKCGVTSTATANILAMVLATDIQNYSG
jgi:hypothetical protein